MPKKSKYGDNKFFEDFYKLAGATMNTAFSTVADMKNQFEDMIDHKVNTLLRKHGFVKIEEFEILQKMVQSCLKQQEKLEEKIAKLEKKLK